MKYHHTRTSLASSAKHVRFRTSQKRFHRKCAVKVRCCDSATMSDQRTHLENTVLKAQAQGDEKIERGFPTGGAALKTDCTGQEKTGIGGRESLEREVQREGGPAIHLRRGPAEQEPRGSDRGCRRPPAAVMPPACRGSATRLRRNPAAAPACRPPAARLPRQCRPAPACGETSASFLVGLGMQYHRRRRRYG